MFRKHLPLLLALTLCSILAATFGLGGSYQRYTASLPAHSTFKGLAKDGWISEKASISFPRLASEGNRLLLSFNSWRPEVPDAHFKISACDQPAQEYLISRSTELAISLRGHCEPRTLRFEVLNPFRASPSDERMLGAQVLSLEVVSKLGVAIVSPSLILAVSFLLVILGLSAAYCFTAWRFRWLALLIPLAALYPLARVDIRDLAKPFWLWVTLVCVTCGFALARISRATVAADRAPATRPNRFAAAAIAALVLGGAALRFYGIDFGLPNNYHPDEIPKVNAIMQMVASDSLNPRYFLHPSLLLYCTYFVNTVFHLAGIEGDFRATAFLAGRTVSAVAGSLSILVVYALGARLYGRRAGFIAAALLAVFPLHVTCSRYLKEDALLLLFILAAAWAVVKAAQEDRKIFLFIAALFAGLAASTKYSGILAAGIIMAAPWLRSRTFVPDKQFSVYSVMALALVPLVFLCASPYIVLDYPKFRSDFNYERKHALRGHTQAIDAWSQYWMYHLARSIVPGIGTLTTLVALLGIGLLAWRRRIEDLFILGLVLAFYLPAEWVKSKPEPQPERYIFPCLPFLAITCAYFIDMMARGKLKRFAPALLILTLGIPLWRTLELARDIRHDTRAQAAQWLLQNVPAQSRVLLDWQPYGPYLPPERLQTDYILRINLLKKLSPGLLEESGNDYLVLSSLFYDRYFTQPFASPVFQNRFKSVFTRVPVLKEFSAPSGTYGFHNPRLTIFSLKPQDFAALDEELALKKAGKIAKTQNEIRARFHWPRQ